LKVDAEAAVDAELNAATLKVQTRQRDMIKRPTADTFNGPAQAEAAELRVALLQIQRQQRIIRERQGAEKLNADAEVAAAAGAKLTAAILKVQARQRSMSERQVDAAALNVASSDHDLNAVAFKIRALQQRDMPSARVAARRLNAHAAAAATDAEVISRGMVVDIADAELQAAKLMIQRRVNGDMGGGMKVLGARVGMTDL
jgi:hypothetical protein